MTFIPLSAWDLSLAAVLVVALTLLTVVMRLNVARDLVIAAVRTVIQLLLVGLVLDVIFGKASLLWVGLMALVMLIAAGYEVTSRQKWRFSGFWGFGLGTLSMFVSSFAVAVLTLTVIIGTEPWYSPQYAIPLLGMLLGNTMNGVALSLDRLTQTVRQQIHVIEQRLLLGATGSEAVTDIRKDCTRSGMIPIINAMATAGIVSLPGMMTGQILSGTPPMEAVKYQILIMFIITAGTGFATALAMAVASRRLFDERQRLRLDRLRKAR